jgi:predicted NBD/HSP70 family sugar kinase
VTEGNSGVRRHAKATKHDSRQTNLRTALELVSRHGATSRAEIARRTGLSRAAVSSLVAELLEERLLRESGQGESAGGKPPILLALNARSREIVAVDLGHQPFQAALIDLSGQMHERVAADEAEMSPTGSRALEMTEELIGTVLDLATAPVLGIGIGAPGVIAPDGRVLEASNLAWHGLDLGAEIRKRFDYPVSIANDAAMAALAEFHRHPTDRNMILIKLGRGVGAGLVLDGQLYRGQHSAAGEIGHVRIEDNGARCSCGRSGCLETRASVPAVLKGMGADPDRDPWDARALAELYGEAAVHSALTEAGRAIGAALAGVVATLDVGQVILAPEMKDAGNVLADAVRDELNSRILAPTSELIEVETTEVGDDLVLAGAASAVLVDRFGTVL